jgi:hypothetical protein
MDSKEFKSTSLIICIKQIIDEVLFDDYSFLSTISIQIFRSTSVVIFSPLPNFAMVEVLIPIFLRSSDLVHPLSMRSFHN